MVKQGVSDVKDLTLAVFHMARPGWGLIVMGTNWSCFPTTIYPDMNPNTAGVKNPKYESMIQAWVPMQEGAPVWAGEKSKVIWDGKAYPRIGYVSDRFRTSVRPVTPPPCTVHVTVSPTPMPSPNVIRVPSPMHSHAGCTALTEQIHASSLKLKAVLLSY